MRASVVAALALVFVTSCDVDRLLRVSAQGAQVTPQAPWSAPHAPWNSPPAATLHLALGTPTDASSQDDWLLTKPQYAVSYNRFRNAPNWVAWRLSASDLGSTGRTRRNFAPDPQLPDGMYRVHDGDYSGSGYDRGHLCPSAQRTADPDDNAATFLTTNILPQRHDLNAGAWENLERWSTDMARAGWDLYTYAGGIWPRECATNLAPTGNAPGFGCPSIGRSMDVARRVAVPYSTWKVIVLVPQGHALDAVNANTPVVAVDMPNDGSAGADWRRYLTTVDTIEARTGYELLGNVHVAVQQAIESRVYAGP